MHFCAGLASGDEAKARRAELALAERWYFCFARIGFLLLCAVSLSGLSVGDIRKVDYALDAVAADDPFVDPDPLDEVVLEVLCLSPPPFS